MLASALPQQFPRRIRDIARHGLLQLEEPVSDETLGVYSPHD
jgi:hypothetical protein